MATPLTESLRVSLGSDSRFVLVVHIVSTQDNPISNTNFADVHPPPTTVALGGMATKPSHAGRRPPPRLECNPAQLQMIHNSDLTWRIVLPLENMTEEFRIGGADISATTPIRLFYSFNDYLCCTVFGFQGWPATTGALAPDRSSSH